MDWGTVTIITVIRSYRGLDARDGILLEALGESGLLRLLGEGGTDQD